MSKDFYEIFVNLFENNNSEIYKLIHEDNVLFKESIKENNTNNTLYVSEKDWHDDNDYIKQEIQKQINLIKALVFRKFSDIRYHKEKLDLDNIKFFVETEFPNIKIDEKIITSYGNNTSAEINLYIVEKAVFNKYLSDLNAFGGKLAELLNLSIYKSFKVKSNILSSSQVESLQLDIERLILDKNSSRETMRRADPDILKGIFIEEVILNKHYFYYYLINNFENSKTNGLFSAIIKKINNILNSYKNLSNYNIDTESISDLTGDEVLNKAISRRGGLFDFLKQGGIQYLLDNYKVNFSLYNLYSNKAVNFEKFNIFFRDINDNKDSILNLDELFAAIEDAFKGNIENIDNNIIGPSIPELNIFLKNSATKKQNSIDEDIERLGNNITLGGSKTIRDIQMYREILEISNYPSLINNMSYKNNINIITNQIADLRDKVEYTLRLGVPRDDYHKYYDMISPFIETFKKIVIKELQENEKFLQGKTDSIKLFDKIKYENTPINNLNVNIEKNPHNKDYYDYNLTYNGEKINSDLNFIIRNLHTYNVYTGNIGKIISYLSIFKDELYKALETNDLNQLRDHIINIINFIFYKNNDSKLGSIIEYGSERNSYGNDILKNIDSDPKKKTKNEKLNLYYQALSLIHNNRLELFSKFIINSAYLTKLNSTAVLEIFECIGNLLNIYDFNQSLSDIIKEKPKLLPSHIYTDVIKNIIDNIFKAKTDNYENIDNVIDIILKNDPSKTIRKLKYVTSIVGNYEAISKWIDLAKEKEEDIFSANFSTESFRFRVLEDFDPYHFQVGVDTNCCQTIGGKGQSAAVDSFINPKAGVVVLEINNGGNWNLAAQSYFHVFRMNENGKEIKGIILDNIEAGRLQSKYEKDDFYPKAYAILGRYLKNKGFDVVGCGEIYTEVIKNRFEKESMDSDPRYFEVEGNNLKRYTDFNHRSFYDLLKPKFFFEMPNDIDSEIKIAKYNNRLLKLSRILRDIKLNKEAEQVYSLVTNL